MTVASLAPPPALSRRVPASFAADACLARFTTDQYDRMVAHGVLGPDDRVELLDNYVVLKMAKNEPHECGVDLVREALSPVKPAGWMLRCQQVVALPHNRPEPDFALVRGTARTYAGRHPTAADAGLVVEVADSSLQLDLTDKAAVYAGGGVPVYWVIDIPHRRVVVHTGPAGPADAGAYGTITAYAPGDAVPLVLDGALVAHLPAADLLP